MCTHNTILIEVELNIQLGCHIAIICAAKVQSETYFALITFCYNLSTRSGVRHIATTLALV